jgi:integrase
LQFYLWLTPLNPDISAAFEKPESRLSARRKRVRRASGAGERRRTSAHVLRKATAARLAEHGATAHEIMAITGHRTLEEVERYTRAAQKARLADSAMAKLK